MARNATLEHWGYLNPCRYVLHDRDKKFCASFRDTLATANVKCLMLPRRSPNLNAFAERPGTQPLPPLPRKQMGRPPRLLRRDADHQPVSVKELALSLAARAYILSRNF